MFCSNANQGFEKFEKFEKGAMEDEELNIIVAMMKNFDLLDKEVQFVNRKELGKFLIDQQSKFKSGQLLTVAQREVLDRALTQILGRSIFY